MTATSLDGQRTTSTVGYLVALPSNRFSVARLHYRHNPGPCGTVKISLRLPGPGVLDVLETAWKDNLSASIARLLHPAAGRFVLARKHLEVKHAGRRTVLIYPNAKGRRLLGHHRYPVVIRLWVSFTPTGGHQRDTGFYDIHLTPRHGHTTPTCQTTNH